MDTSSSLIRVFLFILAGPCATKSSYASILHCQRLVPPDITSALTPCRFPCITRYLRAPFNIIMQSEPDGTPCRHMGHCSAGACLDIGNNAAPDHFEFGPSSGMTSYHNSNTNGDTHAGSTAVSTSGGYARYGFLSEAKVIPYTDQVMSENGKENSAPLFAKELSARSALQHLLRVKRAARRSKEGGRDGIETSESGKHISLARVRRSRKKRRRNRKGGRPQNHHIGYTYVNGNMYGAGSGVYGAPYGPRNPSVIIVGSPRKKSKVKSLLKGAAVGVAAGGAGIATYKLFETGTKPKHTSSNGAGGVEAKFPPPNRTDAEGNAAGAQGTAKGDTGQTGTGTPETNGGGENDEKNKTDGVEAGASPKGEGTATGATEATGTDEARSTNGSKTGASQDAVTDKTKETDNTATDTTDAAKSAATSISANGQGPGTDATEKTAATATGQAVGTGSSSIEKNTDNGRSSSALPTVPVYAEVPGGSKVSFTVNSTGIHIQVHKDSEGSRT
ncbi:sericin 1-like [Dermacentor albipictus]|uniref:sericin 1-like n=1 Tax=Dermacentor albipictus TaxID=60249 RepID=UPI0031FE016A